MTLCGRKDNGMYAVHKSQVKNLGVIKVTRTENNAVLSLATTNTFSFLPTVHNSLPKLFWRWYTLYLLWDHCGKCYFFVRQSCLYGPLAQAQHEIYQHKAFVPQPDSLIAPGHKPHLDFLSPCSVGLTISWYGRVRTIPFQQNNTSFFITKQNTLRPRQSLYDRIWLLKDSVLSSSALLLLRKLRGA